jgi:hypothetical protein
MSSLPMILLLPVIITITTSVLVLVEAVVAAAVAQWGNAVRDAALCLQLELGEATSILGVKPQLSH